MRAVRFHEHGGPEVLSVEEVADPVIGPGEALVVFPGGFGTLDEMFEILTLVQTDKLSKKIGVILYGREYWDDVLDFRPMAEWGAIAEKDVELFKYCETPTDAFENLRAHLIAHHLEPSSAQEAATPGIAKTRG